MAANKKSSALDDLMMACSDLSGGARRQGFKGPPVKDIRREAPKQVTCFFHFICYFDSYL